MKAIFQQVFRIIFSLLYIPFSIVSLLVTLILPKKLIQRIYQRTDKLEHGRRVTFLKRYIQPGETVLDVGAGNCRFAKKVEEALEAKVVGVDVTNYKDAPIDMHVFDGKHLPFEDNAFDVVMLCFVLHRCKDQETIFREVVRCARRRIVVIEDTFRNRIEYAYCFWNDYHSNILQGFVKMLKGLASKGVLKIPMPFNFRSILAWETFFSKFNVKIKEKVTYSKVYKPMTHVIFELEKTS